jgi:hypothetical protein
MGTKANKRKNLKRRRLMIALARKLGFKRAGSMSNPKLLESVLPHFPDYPQFEELKKTGHFDKLAMRRFASWYSQTKQCSEKKGTPSWLTTPAPTYSQTPSDPKAFYRSWAWREVRFLALEKHGRRCQCCGATPDMLDIAGNPVRIVVDHIKPLRHNWDLRLSLDNLQILCDECNMGKSYKHETDFRPATA